MGQSRKAARQQMMAQRQSRRRWRLGLLVGAPLIIIGIVAVVALTRPPGYSGFDVIGKHPAIVQVLLPG
jgi:hypothetical protein